MFKFISGLFLFLCCSVTKTTAQCNLNLPDTICPGQTIFLSTGLQQATFDACVQTPENTANIVQGIGTNVYEYSVFKDKGKYFAFGQQIGSGYIHRFEFDAQFNFISSQLIAPNPAPSINLHIGSDMIRTDAGKYVAMLPASDANKVLRFEFDSIDDNNPDVIDFAISNFNAARGCKLYGSYLFVANSGANNIIRIEFDSVFQNIIQVTDINGPFTIPWGIDIEYDCTTNNYFGFIANDGGLIIRLDFGNSLSNPNPTSTIITNTYSETIGIDVERIDNKWYLFTNNFGILQRYLQFKLDSLTAIPTLMIDTVNSALNPFGVTVFNDSNITRVFTSANFAHILFQNQACISSPAWQNFTDTLSVTFNANDTGLVKFDIKGFTNGVQQVYTDSVFVTIRPPAAGFKNTGTCLSQVVVFTDTSTICYGAIVNWLWDFGDANTSNVQHPAHTYNIAGNYQVTLTVYAANGDSAVCIKNITVVPLPQADFTLSNDTVCQFETVFFNDASTSVNDSIVNWLWFYDTAGAVTPQAQFAFPTSGNFQVLLIATNSNGCTDSVTKPVVVQPGPQSSFNVLNTCLGNAVLFNNTSFTAGLAAVYNWSFGDGNQSTDINPQHAYAWVDSSYLISLTTQTSNGCAHTYFDSIAITQPAIINISLSADTICKNENVTIINSSTYSGNSVPVKTEWYLSDGSFFTNVDTLQHAFTQAGLQSVMLLITTPTACDTFITKSIYVLANPTASFTTTQVCLGDSTLLASTAFAPAGDFITAHSWQLGNGMHATDSITKVLYDSAATYQIWHTVTTANGCTDSTMGYSNVYALPVANFSIPVAVCSDSITNFIDFSFIPTDTIVNWYWNFGNGITDSSKNGQVQFQNAGNYNVQLTVTSSKGCMGDTVKTITVKPSPMPAFVTANNCYNDYMQFSFVNMAPSQGLINQWQWNFGEQGALSVLENPFHKYANPGTFIVTVTATDTNLCFTSIQQNVVVNALPDVGFTVTNPCNQTQTVFNDTSVANGIAGFEWNIQGQIFTTNTVNFLFDNAGTYPITLSVISDSNCTNTLQQNVIIHNLPQASFTTQPLYAMPLQTVNYINSSLYATQYVWSFGNGLSSTIMNPTTVYSDTGSYLNQLIVINDYGCADTVQQTFKVLYPRIEVALTDVYYTLSNNLLNVSSRLVNLGNLPVADFDMILRVDGLPELLEKSNKILPVGGQPVVYDFKSQIALTDFFDATYFCAEINLPDGMVDNPINNKKCSALDTKWQILQILPNPVKNLGSLYLQATHNTKAQLKIINLQGAAVFNQTIMVKKGFNNLPLNLSSLSDGMYLIQINADDVLLQQRFMKVH